MSAGFNRSRRLLVPELMDVERIAPADLAVCLADLERLSRLTLGRRPTLLWLSRVTAGLPRGASPLLLDVACGGGDMLRAMRRWADRRGLALRLRGLDINPQMVAVARARTPPDAAIDYAVGDALDPPGGEPPDLITSALFAHHLDADQLDRFLRWMQRTARRGWLVNDLHRHPVPYWFLCTVLPLARMHRFVRHDGPVSVARALTGREWREALDRAGIAARIRWHAPFRWTIEGRPG